MKRGNCAGPKESYFSAPFGGRLVRFSRQLQTHPNLLFWASKSANRRVKSALSMQSFSGNCALGNTDTCSFIVWQHGKWPKFSRSICVSHRRSLVLNAFSDHMILPLKLQVERIEMARNATQKRCVFPFAFHELTDFLKQLFSTLPRLSHRTSV